MQKYAFLFIFLFSLTAYSDGRSPAVEDFVGVEAKNYQETPKGTEVLFNFGNHIKLSNNAFNSSKTLTTPYFGFFVMFAFFALPFLMYIALTKTVSHTAIAEEEFIHEPSQVTSFEDNLIEISTRRDVEKDEDLKKAS